MKKFIVVAVFFGFISGCAKIQTIAPVAQAINDKVNEACVELDRTSCVGHTETSDWLINTIVDINGTVLEAIVEDSSIGS